MREEGVTKLFSGAAMATSRAVFMTIGQLSFYDQIKQIAIASGYFKDNPATHFGSSFAAVPSSFSDNFKYFFFLHTQFHLRLAQFVIKPAKVFI